MSLTIREEKILEAAVAGEQSPIEPVTRREAIFAKATGADVELPPARNKEEDILSKLAVGYAEGGGGGGGDFSTAIITFVDNDQEGWQFQGPFLGADNILLSAYSDEANTQTVVLYKGLAVLECEYETFTVSGNAEKDATRPAIVNITGDCTITIPEGGIA